jgi:hypothetical protein
MEYGVSVNVNAAPDIVWALLTDAARFSSWNSTVASIEGRIALGERLKLKVPLAPGRTFKPRVTALVPRERMVWSDGAPPMFKGVRTFTLHARADGSTDFSMVEAYSGLMLPLIAGSLPDFGPSFEQYARDLKKAAESAGGRP